MLDCNDNAQTVAETMERIVPTLSIDRPVRESDLDALFGDSQFVPVVNEHRRVLGLASKDDLRAAVAAGGGVAAPKAVMLLGVPLLRASYPATRAVDQLRASRVDLLPVVDDERRLVGVVSAGRLALRASSGPASRAVDEFARCLDAVEREADAGLVPGDLDRWRAPVADRTAELGARWAERQRERFEILDAMRELDPALHATADALAAVEIELRDRFSALCFALGHSRSARSQAGRETLETLRTDLLHWIADVRAHDGDLTTWYNEALLRDRGAVD